MDSSSNLCVQKSLSQSEPVALLQFCFSLAPDIAQFQLVTNVVSTGQHSTLHEGYALGLRTVSALALLASLSAMKCLVTQHQHPASKLLKLFSMIVLIFNFTAQDVPSM